MFPTLFRLCLTDIGNRTDTRSGMGSDYAADAAYLRTDNRFFIHEGDQIFNRFPISGITKDWLKSKIRHSQFFHLLPEQLQRGFLAAGLAQNADFAFRKRDHRMNSKQRPGQSLRPWTAVRL